MLKYAYILSCKAISRCTQTTNRLFVAIIDNQCITYVKIQHVLNPLSVDSLCMRNMNLLMVLCHQ